MEKRRGGARGRGRRLVERGRGCGRRGRQSLSAATRAAQRAADGSADKKKRAEEIRAAKAELEAEAKAAGGGQGQSARPRPTSGDEPRAAETGRPAASPSEEPDPKAQKNLHDTEAAS